MKASVYLAAAALGLWPMLGAAEPLYLSGTIGKAPVLVMLARNGGELSGWYLYLRYGREIGLDGTIDAAGNFTLNETPRGGAAVTGIFQGAVHGAQWAGIWKNPKGGAPVALALGQNRDRLTGVSGRFACDPEFIDRGSGYRFDESLSLTLARGTMSRLEVAHGSSGVGDEQYCSLGLSDLERASSDTGILFRAKDDDPNATEGGHCSVRIVAAGDYLYFQMGDFTEDGNDCVGTDGGHFCSVRGNWNDLIVDRKTGTCTMVQ